MAIVSLNARAIRLRENNTEVHLGLINKFSIVNVNRIENDLAQIGER
jgi:hypothetical protein